jgi:hypothetical protein
MLPPKKTVWMFALRFGCILAVYAYPWRPIGSAYSGIATALANWIVGGAPHGETLLSFARLEQSAAHGSLADAFNMVLRAENTTTGSTITIPIDLRTLTYIPTVVFIALSVAAPIWQGTRGTRVLLFGLAVLQVFLTLSIAVPLLLFFGNPQPMHLVDLGPASYRILSVLYRALVAPPGMAFAVPGLLWLIMLWIVPAPSEGATADGIERRLT